MRQPTMHKSPRRAVMFVQEPADVSFRRAGEVNPLIVGLTKNQGIDIPRSPYVDSNGSGVGVGMIDRLNRFPDIIFFRRSAPASPNVELKQAVRQESNEPACHRRANCSRSNHGRLKYTLWNQNRTKQ